MLASVHAPLLRRPTFQLAPLGATLAVAILAVRTFENPGDSATSIRIAASALALAAAIIVRHRSLAQRAAIFFSVEVLGGIIAFACVDFPFLDAHRAQITAMTIGLFQAVHHVR